MAKLYDTLPPPEAFLTIEDARQADMLSDTRRFEYFTPFVAQEQSVSEAATEVGCSLETMLYHVNRFLDAGLLRVAREKPRAGRPIKLYRSVADAFFVPFHLTSYTDLEAWLLDTTRPFQQRLMSSLAKTLHQHELYGQKIYRAPDGEVWRSSAERAADTFEQGIPLGTHMQDNMYLTDEEARAFQEALRDLWEEHHRGIDEAEGRSLFALSFAFAKLEP